MADSIPTVELKRGTDVAVVNVSDAAAWLADGWTATSESPVEPAAPEPRAPIAPPRRQTKREA